MARIDVSFLLDDPDFIDDFVVNRFRHTVDVNGRVIAVPIGAVTTHGSVQAAGGRTMTLMPDLTTVNGTIDIWTKYRLEVSSDTTLADIVTWQGRHYKVMSVQPWTNYGFGFIHASCTMLEFLAPPPDNVLPPPTSVVIHPDGTPVTTPDGQEVQVIV